MSTSNMDLAKVDGFVIRVQVFTIQTNYKSKKILIQIPGFNCSNISQLETLKHPEVMVNSV